MGKKQMMKCESCNEEIIRKTINQKYCLRCSSKIGKEKSREAEILKKGLKINDEWDYVLQEISNLCDAVNENVRLDVLCSAMISYSVSLLYLNKYNAVIDDEMIKKLIVESVSCGKKSGIEASKFIGD